MDFFPAWTGHEDATCPGRGANARTKSAKGGTGPLGLFGQSCSLSHENAGLRPQKAGFLRFV